MCASFAADSLLTLRLSLLLPLLLLLLLLLHVDTVHSDTDKLSVADFVIVAPTSLPRLPLIHAARGFRLGVRTYIMVESEAVAKKLDASEGAKKHLETYTYWPDRVHKKEAGRKVGDNRWLVAPFLAHAHYGSTYRWMLFGDDDSLFLLTGMMKLLQPYDSGMPYWISDYLVDQYKARGRRERGYVHRDKFGATCLPCHTSDTTVVKMQLNFKTEVLKMDPWKGCPCTSQQSCAHRMGVCEAKGIKDEQFCSMKKSDSPFALQLNASTVHPLFVAMAQEEGLNSCDFTWANGGSGIVLSSTLMSMVGWDKKVKQYVEDFDQPCCAHQSGDWGFAKLLHEHGFGLTLPDYSAELTGKVLSMDHLVFNPSSRRPHLAHPHKLLPLSRADATTSVKRALPAGASADADNGAAGTATGRVLLAVTGSDAGTAAGSHVMPAGSDAGTAAGSHVMPADSDVGTAAGSHMMPAGSDAGTPAGSLVMAAGSDAVGTATSHRLLAGCGTGTVVGTATSQMLLGGTGTGTGVASTATSRVLLAGTGSGIVHAAGTAAGRVLLAGTGTDTGIAGTATGRVLLAGTGTGAGDDRRDVQSVDEWLIRHAVSIHISVYTEPHNGNISSAAHAMSKMAWSHKVALASLGEEHAHLAGTEDWE